MSGAWLLLGLLAASGAAPKVALPGLTSVKVEEGLTEFLNEQLAQELAANGVEVVTRKEISTVLGFERQRQLMGCGPSSESCILELADAMGADAVLVGDVARVGAQFHLVVKVLKAGSGRRLADYTGQTAQEEQLPTLVRQAAAALAPQLAQATGKPLGPVRVATSPVTLAANPSGSVRGKAWIPAVAGGVLCLGGGGAYLVARARYDSLDQRPPAAHAEAVRLAEQGKTWQTVAAVGASVGTAALVAGAVMYLTGEPRTSPSVVLSSSGVAVGLSGVFP